MESGDIPVIIRSPRESTSFSSVIAEVNRDMAKNEINTRFISPMLIRKYSPVAFMSLDMLVIKNWKSENKIIPSITKR
jgi:hypothetical protein